MITACLAFNIVLGTITGYSSDVGQTDARPFETASGEEVGLGVIACPSRYPFGTKVEVLGREYACLDRMNKRYRDGDYFDIWFESKEEALKWGRQELYVSLVNNTNNK